MENKTALVLSGGGMFGAYEAGAWDVLSTVFDPDIVVGASVGALNGWMIASDCPPSHLVELWLKLPSGDAPRWRMPRSLSQGLLDNSRLESWIADICSQWQPRRELGIVLSELRTLQPRLFRGPDLTAQHVGASCGVPLFLKQYRIGGITYSDGGLADPLPLWAAVEMGARRIVAVDVLHARPWFIRAALRTVRAYSRYRECSRENIEVLEIFPSERLGRIRDSMRWTRTNAERWIELGRNDTAAALRSCTMFAKRSGTDVVRT